MFATQCAEPRAVNGGHNPDPRYNKEIHDGVTPIRNGAQISTPSLARQTISYTDRGLRLEAARLRYYHSLSIPSYPGMVAQVAEESSIQPSGCQRDRGPTCQCKHVADGLHSRTSMLWYTTTKNTAPLRHAKPQVRNGRCPDTASHNIERANRLQDVAPSASRLCNTSASKSDRTRQCTG